MEKYGTEKTPHTGKLFILTFKACSFPAKVFLLMIQECTGQWYAVRLDNYYTTPELTTTLLQMKTNYGTLTVEW